MRFKRRIRKKRDLKKEQEDLKNEMKAKKSEKGKEVKASNTNVVEDVAKFYGAPPQAALHQSVKMEELKAAQKNTSKKETTEVKKEYAF